LETPANWDLFLEDVQPISSFLVYVEILKEDCEKLLTEIEGEKILKRIAKIRRKSELCPWSQRDKVTMLWNCLCLPL
jgi:hypothetical protein